MGECKICGGVNKCPRIWYEEVLEMPQDAIKEIPIYKPIPDGWKATHLKERRRIICKTEPLPGYDLELVGHAQAHRIYAHYGVAGEWVGQCTYAFCVKHKERAADGH